jgi:hypothetical protein
MKFVIQTLAILIIAFISELFVPWWCIAVVAFIFGFLLKSQSNFLAGFIAIALLWTIKSLTLELYAATPFTEKVAHIFALPTKTLLFVITALIGGLVGGFSALTGSLLKKKKRYYY